MAEKVLDCTGLFCPEPVFRTRMALDERDSGQILEVHAKLAVAYYLGLPLDLFQRLTVSPASSTVMAIGEMGSQLLALTMIYFLLCPNLDSGILPNTFLELLRERIPRDQEHLCQVQKLIYVR